jgi:hypothetical protein
MLSFETSTGSCLLCLFWFRNCILNIRLSWWIYSVIMLGLLQSVMQNPIFSCFVYNPCSKSTGCLIILVCMGYLGKVTAHRPENQGLIPGKVRNSFFVTRLRLTLGSTKPLGRGCFLGLMGQSLKLASHFICCWVWDCVQLHLHSPFVPLYQHTWGENQFTQGTPLPEFSFLFLSQYSAWN